VRRNGTGTSADPVEHPEADPAVPEEVEAVSLPAVELGMSDCRVGLSATTTPSTTPSKRSAFDVMPGSLTGAPRRKPSLPFPVPSAAVPSSKEYDALVAADPASERPTVSAVTVRVVAASMEARDPWRKRGRVITRSFVQFQRLSTASRCRSQPAAKVIGEAFSLQ
jgi:hypothetical protein